MGGDGAWCVQRVLVVAVVVVAKVARWWVFSLELCIVGRRFRGVGRMVRCTAGSSFVPLAAKSVGQAVGMGFVRLLEGREGCMSGKREEEEGCLTCQVRFLCHVRRREKDDSQMDIVTNKTFDGARER